MYVKRTAAAAAIVGGVAMAALTFGAGQGDAAPLDPPSPCPNCQPGPDGTGAAAGGNPAPPSHPRIHIPCSGGGSPMGGGGAHPCLNN